VRTTVGRVLAAFFALSWLVFPGFGLIDLGVTWDPDWPVVLEASWGVFMTVLVGGSFLAVAVRPARAAPATATLLVALASMLVSAALGLEPPLLGYAGLLAVQIALLLPLGPARERLEPRDRSVWWPLLVVALAGGIPWLVHAAAMFRANRADAGALIGEQTMGVDHHAVQGALALALVVLALVAAGWPRGRRYLGSLIGICAGYLGLVSVAFPSAWAGFDPVWSWLCIGWGAAVAILAVAAPRLQPRELRREVVEAQ
jgi:hypothetical protein